MGVASSNRGNALIARQAHEANNNKLEIEQLIIMAEVAEECNIFSREAWAFIVEPKGLCKSTVEWSKTRKGWDKRYKALVNANNQLVNSDYFNVPQYHYASVKKAKATLQLFIFCLGSWVIPSHITIPRAAK